MGELGVLIPIFSIAIPLVAVCGRFIVQPIVGAMARMAEAQERLATVRGGEERLARLEAQLAMMEQSLNRVAEAQEFQGRLLEKAND
jgi:hypothetical protein